MVKGSGRNIEKLVIFFLIEEIDVYVFFIDIILLVVEVKVFIDLKCIEVNVWGFDSSFVFWVWGFKVLCLDDEEKVDVDRYVVCCVIWYLYVDFVKKEVFIILLNILVIMFKNRFLVEEFVLLMLFDMEEVFCVMELEVEYLKMYKLWF